MLTSRTISLPFQIWIINSWLDRPLRLSPVVRSLVQMMLLRSPLCPAAEERREWDRRRKSFHTSMKP